MNNDCGCNGGQTTASTATPTLEPPSANASDEGSSMSDQQPTLTPPTAATSTGASGAGDTVPTLTPSTMASGTGGIAAWNNDKRVSALWGINQNRNSWVYITGVGWKRLANNSDSAVMALTALAAHAKQTQTAYSYRDEADGMIHESYVW